jgi:hypothetical protein
MTAAAAMAELDRLVTECREDDRYPVAKALYEAALHGLVDVPLSPTLLYRWVVKWALLPGTRGQRG